VTFSIAYDTTQEIVGTCDKKYISCGAKDETAVRFRNVVKIQANTKYRIEAMFTGEDTAYHFSHLKLINLGDINITHSIIESSVTEVGAANRYRGQVLRIIIKTLT
jgi:hypothetical protein